RQSAMAPTDTEVTLLLQVFQMFEDIVAILVAVVLAGVTFAIDYVTPRTMNLPILYLMPLSVVAITRSVLMLWLSVPILLVLSYIGYFYGPAIDLDIDRTAINRELVAGSIVVAAALFHLLCVPGRGRNRKVETAATPN